MTAFEFLTWFYSWFFAVTIPAVLFVYIYGLFEERK